MSTPQGYGKSEQLLLKSQFLNELANFNVYYKSSNK